jgi:hypothetical protein
MGQVPREPCFETRWSIEHAVKLGQSALRQRANLQRRRHHFGRMTSTPSVLSGNDSDLDRGVILVETGLGSDRIDQSCGALCSAAATPKQGCNLRRLESLDPV